MGGRRQNTNRKRSKKYPSMRGGIPETKELKNLLYAISEAFPLVISVNLTKNTYEMLEYENYTTKKAATRGVFDDLITVGASTLDPAHKQKFIETFSRDKLLEAYARGEKKVAYECRQLKDNGEYGWVKTTVIFLKNDASDDVLQITLAGPIEEQKARELENYRLRKLMESVILANYEYVCILDKRTGAVELYAKNENNTHRVPLKGDYDTILKTIRDTLIPKEDRKDYYGNLKLSVLSERMAENPSYSYRYRLCDTPEMRWREATYNCCTPEGDDILVTVRDVHDEVLAEQVKHAEKLLRRNKERQKLLSGLGLEVVIDHDLLTGHVEVLGETEELLKRKLIRKNFPQGEIDAGLIHPDDIGMLVKPDDLVKLGDTFSVDFRMKRGDGSFFWCRCQGVVLRDENGKPYRCLHKLTDVDSQKKSEQKLMYDAQRDSLTGLYNNMTTHTLIENYLAGEGAGLGNALLVLDIDNLKEVNDTLGHKAGDRLIQSLAKVMTSSLRSTDIIGRVGGDEFVVLLKNIESSSNVLESLYAMKKRIKPLKIDEKTCILPMFSIGVSLYPQDGRTYDELFRHADAAMYYVKGHGKNGVKLYESAIDSAK
jgi:diguanylate cyclase (GGDEF)-like protein